MDDVSFQFSVLGFFGEILRIVGIAVSFFWCLVIALVLRSVLPGIISIANPALFLWCFHFHEIPFFISFLSVCVSFHMK